MMRRLILATLCLLWPLTAAAQITVTQSPAVDNNAYTAGVKTYTGLTSVTTGRTYACGVANGNDRGFSSVTLGGQAMTACTNSAVNDSFADQAIYVRVADGSESGANVVVTLTGSDGNNTAMACVEITGAAASLSATGAAVHGTGADNYTTSGVTAGTAHNIGIGYSGSRANRSWTTNAGWTDVANVNAYNWSHYIKTSASSTTYGFSTGDGAGGAELSMCVIDGAAGGGGGSTARTMTLLGVGAQ